MTKSRKQKLERNFTTMFWVQALLNVRVLNIVFTLFYLHRGLTLEQIFYLSIVFAIVTLLFEIPSSYLADRWGRKNTIIFGVICALFNWGVLLYAQHFWMFVLSMAFFAIQYASFTGTDDALIYDTNKELGNHHESLKRLSIYYSARNFIKIFAPLLGVYIAKDLVEWQFVAVIWLDIVTVFLALVLALRITEPHHYMDVEKLEAGILKDGISLIKNNPAMIRGILSKTIIFIGSFIIWRYHQELLVTFLGMSVVALGIGWSIFHGGTFLWNRYITPRFNRHVAYYIDLLNGLFFLSSAVALFILILFPHPYLVFASILAISFTEITRNALYSQFFNNFSNSFNRATTMSLANFLKSILDLPLLFLAAILVKQNMTYPFILTILLALSTILFFKISSKKYERQTS